MEFFEIENLNSIRKIVINNPRKRNALNRKAYITLATLLNQAATDKSVKCIVVTGKGDFYSSGNDLTQDFSQFEEDSDKNDPVRQLVRAFFTFPKLLICLVNGPCIGIAATTAALADVVYCSETAYFYTPFTALGEYTVMTGPRKENFRDSIIDSTGLCSEGCSSYTFPLILGWSKASEMLLMNHKMTAQEAYHFKLVAQIYKHESEIWEKLKQIDKLPIGSIKSIKRLMRQPLIEKYEEVNNEELKELAERFESEEALEAIINFSSARKSKL